MRRVGHLFEQMITRDNLRMAFHRASRGKRSHGVVREFAADLERRLTLLIDELRQGTVPLGRFHQFVIRDPKERVITAPCFEERVLHHAVISVCEPVFDRWLIEDTYACRVGKGREAAVLRASRFARSQDWYVQLDIRKYFDSIPHKMLCELLRRRFKDQRLLELLDRTITSFRGEIGAGLPIGSLTSQHLANFYLGWCDRYLKQTLRIRGYVRYMDDLVFWHSERHQLIVLEQRCREFLHESLGLEAKPTTLQRTSHGLTFLGCRIFPTHVALSRRSKRRWGRRMRSLERAARLGLIGERELQARIEAATAFAVGAGAKSWRFRQAVLKQIRVGDP